MPFRIQKVGDKYEVVTIETGKSHGITTHEMAEKQMRLLEGLIQGEKRPRRRAKVYHKGEKMY